MKDLEILGKDKIKGKIVFNRPTDQRLISTGSAYGGAVDQRTAGPAEAAKYGAVAGVIRSIGTAFDDVPPILGLLGMLKEQRKYLLLH